MSFISRVNWNKTIFLNKRLSISVVWILTNIYIAMSAWPLVHACDCWKRRNYKTCSWMDCYTMIIRQCLHLLCKTDRSHQYSFTFICIKLCNEIFMVRLILSNTFSTTFHIMWILIGKIYLKWKKIFKLIGYK